MAMVLSPLFTKKVAKEDILCYATVDIIGKKTCQKYSLNCKIGKQLPRVEIHIIGQGGGWPYAEGGYFAYSEEGDCNAVFFIPAGTVYYVGLRGDYMSESLVLKALNGVLKMSDSDEKRLVSQFNKVCSVAEISDPSFLNLLTTAFKDKVSHTLEYPHGAGKSATMFAIDLRREEKELNIDSNLSIYDEGGTLGKIQKCITLPEKAFGVAGYISGSGKSYFILIYDGSLGDRQPIGYAYRHREDYSDWSDYSGKYKSYCTWDKY
jgi:hypothetical protein